MQPPGQRNKIDPNTNKRKSMKPSNTFIPELDTSPAAMSVIRPVTIHFHAKCRVGSFIDRSRIRPMITAPNHKTLAKLILQEILNSCYDTTQLAPRFLALDGEVNVVAAGSKNFTVKIPSSNSISDAEFLQFVNVICGACEACPHFMTLESGSDKCDNCFKQEQLHDEKKIKEIEEAKKQTLEKNTNETSLIGAQRPAESKVSESKAKPTYKRRRESDIDMESSTPSPTSTSSSSSSSSNSEQYAKIPRKSFDESVSTTTSRSLQTKPAIIFSSPGKL